jgi:hypothetical protein
MKWVGLYVQFQHRGSLVVWSSDLCMDCFGHTVHYGMICFIGVM